MRSDLQGKSDRRGHQTSVVFLSVTCFACEVEVSHWKHISEHHLTQVTETAALKRRCIDSLMTHN